MLLLVLLLLLLLLLLLCWSRVSDADLAVVGAAVSLRS
jgi:hypothetical protein